MLTIEDLRKPQNVSGYKQVGRVAGPSRTGTAYFQAYAAGGRGGDWKGTGRATAEEAAQDYCDWYNTQRPQQSVQLQSAGHDYSIERGQRDPEVEAALGVLRDAKAQREGKQGYVYLITDGTAYKIGYSVNPQKRVAELQTGNPRVLTLVAFRKGTEADERALHAKFIKLNLLQEWFDREAVILDEFKEA